MILYHALNYLLISCAAFCILKVFGDIQSTRLLAPVINSNTFKVIVAIILPFTLNVITLIIITLFLIYVIKRILTK